MTLSRSATLLRGSSVVALAIAVALTGSTLAQSPRLAPDARGFQSTLTLQQAQRQRPAPRVAAAPVVTPARVHSRVQVTVQAPVETARAEVTPAPADASSIAIRGPDGDVRRYPLEGGQASIVVRQYTITPGEAVTVRINPGR